MRDRGHEGAETSAAEVARLAQLAYDRWRRTAPKGTKSWKRSHPATKGEWRYCVRTLIYGGRPNVATWTPELVELVAIVIREYT
jgi:hypothetical protein